jgi:tetraacyldisaccharide 4'-kinase
LPGGRLREPLSAARAADAVLVSGVDADAHEGLDAIAARLGVGTAFAIHRDVEPPVEETLAGPRPLEAGARVVVVSGIARPERFVEESRGAAVEIAGDVRFRDHHAYSAADVNRIAQAARAADAPVVLTTEKDYVRLLPLRPWPFRLAVRPLSVRVEPADAFASWLLGRLSAARGRRVERLGSEGAA